MNRYLRVQVIDGDLPRAEMDAHLWTFCGRVVVLDAHGHETACLGTYTEQFPRSLRQTHCAQTAEYNALDAFKRLAGRHGDRLRCIIQCIPAERAIG